MPEKTIPYLAGYGSITKGLNAIKKAKTPTKFSQDYLATTLKMPGGTAKPLIPFLKKTGFLTSSGEPTQLYIQFRNPTHSGVAAANALKKGFAALYEVNEYIHDADDQALKGVVVQVTGAEPDSSIVKSVVGSFKALKAFADFEAEAPEDNEELEGSGESGGDAPTDQLRDLDLNLGYTINIHLPPTSDIAVFNAIFKSLKENILPK
jgi:hypothetical protein